MLANIFSNIGLTEDKRLHFLWNRNSSLIPTRTLSLIRRANSRIEDSGFEFWVADRSQFG
jgi:hypothetical protein